MTQEKLVHKEMDTDDDTEELSASQLDTDALNLSERHALDGDHVQPPLVQCFRCARRFPGPFCEAFPGGIPEDLQLGSFYHTNAYPNDNGLRFVEGRSPHIKYQDEQ